MRSNSRRALPQSGRSLKLTKAPAQIHAITRAAAKTRFTTAISLISKLEQAHLQSFWYFASKINLAIIATFGSLLWVTSENEEERSWYREKLAEYRWLLRVSSKSAEFMGFTVGMLDASAVFLREKDVGSGTTPISAGGILQQQQQQELQEDRGEEMSDEEEGNEEMKTEHSSSHHQHHQQNNNSYEFPIQSYFPSTTSKNNQEQVISPANTSTSHSNTNHEPPQSTSYDPNNISNGMDTRPTWSHLPVSSAVDFDSGDIQDWNLDQLYNFENFPLAEDVLSHSRRFVREYDESGNAFAGF